MDIPIVEGFEANVLEIEAAINEKIKNVSNSLFPDRTIMLLTDYGRDLYRKKFYKEAENVICTALLNDTDIMARNAMKLLYSIYMDTGRKNRLKELDKWKQYHYISDEVEKQIENVDPKEFLKTIKSLKKKPNEYVMAIDEEVVRITSNYYHESITLKFEIVKYLIANHNYQDAWVKLNSMSLNLIDSYKYLYLSKIEDYRSEISEIEKRYKDCLLSIILKEMYKQYNAYLFYSISMPRYEELNGHPLTIKEILVDCEKNISIINNANAQSIIKEIENNINVIGSTNPNNYLSYIQTIIESLKKC